MSDERLEVGEPCMVSISAGLRPIHKKAVVTSVKPKGYDVLCEGETTERHVSEKKAKRLSGRKATAALEIPKYTVREQPPLSYADIKETMEWAKKNSVETDANGMILMPIHQNSPLLRPSVEAVVRTTKPQPKSRPRWRSAEYLKFVGEHDCCGCGAPAPSDAHHWGGTLKGMGLKFDDLLTVPLSRGCHDHFHRTGKLPGMTTAETHLRFRETQVALLVEWVLLRFDEVSDA